VRFVAVRDADLPDVRDRRDKGEDVNRSERIALQTALNALDDGIEPRMVADFLRAFMLRVEDDDQRDEDED
jgi:hypothetical protein